MIFPTGLTGPRLFPAFLAVGHARFKEFSIKKQKKIDVKRAQLTARDAKFRHVLTEAKAAKRANDHGNAKRKANTFLVRYLGVPLCGLNNIRSEADYQARSHNLSRQVLALIDHLLVQYPVPLFLYRSVLSAEGIELVFGEKTPCHGLWKLPVTVKYRDWFLAVARGQSFAKLTKDVFSKREAHLFLQAPGTNRIGENVLWARATAAGIAPEGTDYLVRRIDATVLRCVGDRLPDLLRFYSIEWPNMRRFERDQVFDFLRTAMQDPRFSMKGRTLLSVRKLSRDWHRSFYTNVLGEYRSWNQSFGPWEHRKAPLAVRAIELTNNRALSDEGLKQRHCVYAYANDCIRGQSRIVSFRWFGVASDKETPTVELERITAEVSTSSRSIVQIRGRNNRAATDTEMAIIRKWAGEHGIPIDSWANSD